MEGCRALLAHPDSTGSVDGEAVIYALAGICVGLPVGIIIGVNIAFWMVGGIK